MEDRENYLLFCLYSEKFPVFAFRVLCLVRLLIK